LSLPMEERIEILALLALGSEPDLREKALETLHGLDLAEVRRVLASPQTAPDVLQFAAEKLLPQREELREVLFWNPSLPAAVQELVKPKPVPKAEPAMGAPKSSPEAEPVTAAPVQPDPPSAEPGSPSAPAEQVNEPSETPQSPTHQDESVSGIEILAKLAAGEKIEDIVGPSEEPPPEAMKRDDELSQHERLTLIEKINKMSVVQKIKAAVTGNLETRQLLIRDSNKIISRAVLQSPKISDTEAEGYAAAKNVSEEVLRLIAANRKFMKTYVIMRALVNNPRAPIDITMPMLNRLNERDLKGVSLNRNVPEIIRTLAIKAIKQKEEASKPKLPGKH
jgi:hypothetical protein